MARDAEAANRLSKSRSRSPAKRQQPAKSPPPIEQVFREPLTPPKKRIKPLKEGPHEPEKWTTTP